MFVYVCCCFSESRTGESRSENPTRSRHSGRGPETPRRGLRPTASAFTALREACEEGATYARWILPVRGSRWFIMPMKYVYTHRIHVIMLYEW